MSPQTAPVSLAEIQRPLRARLEKVQQELRRVVEADFGLITEVNAHLFRMQGKLFRPTLLLLSDEATGGPDPRASTLAAVVELIHLATLVHDDSVDHSVLRRGMPTINALFSHQISVIMGDYLYSRAVIELVRLGDLEPLRVLSRVTNEMTVGEMRQLLAQRQSDRRKKAPARPDPEAGSLVGEITTHEQLAVLRRELNGLVAAWHHRTGQPHGITHAALRKECGGPAAAVASADMLR